MIRYVMALMLVAVNVSAAETDWATDYEKSGYKATPRYAETIRYCERLAGGSRWVRLKSFGTSPQGRELPLLVVDRHGTFSPNRIRGKGNVVVLIQGGIHAGEIDGKDAGLMLIRDITVANKYPELLDNVAILFIPIFNVDGHERFGPYNRINQNGPEEMGWRTTAQNLNLNRDYLKADAPETCRWLDLYNEWLPEFFIDCHVTDGADYQYVLTYGLEIFGNMAPSLTTWTRDRYLPSIERAMSGSGFPISPYVVLKRGRDLREGIMSWTAPPMLSEGYTAIQNRPGLLIETHMLKDYRSRVSATYEMLRHTLEILNAEYKSLRAAIEEADELTASPAFRKERFPLRFTADSTYTMIDFAGVECDMVESELSGGTWYRFGSKPETLRIPYYDKQRPTVLVELPEAYIVPPEWSDVIERLELHGIGVKRLDRPQLLHVTSYTFKNVRWRQWPYEGRHPVSFEIEAVEEERMYPKGSVVVDMNQRAARVAAHILEPEGPDSYVKWGFFDAIFEQKEYTESYVMEVMAREMLAEDDELRKAFEKKKAEDQEFAENPRAILNWFYLRSPYRDRRMKVYPVGKIMDRRAVEALDT